MTNGTAPETNVIPSEVTLLPCPFCGGEAELYSTIPTHDGFWCCICRDCGASTSFGSEAEAIAAWNARAEDAESEMAQRIQSLELECAKLQDELRKAGNRGSLTAEQVRTAIFNGSSYASYDGAKYYADGISMQAIADELNEALGVGECEYVIEDNMNESEGMGDVWFRCTNCNMKFEYYADDWLMKQNHCPHCGFKIRKAVKR